MTARLETIGSVPLFEGLEQAELASLAERTRELTVATGAEVIHEGDQGSEFFVITAGSLEIRIGGRTVNVLGPGDFLGELALMFGAPRNASAIALEPTTLLALDKDDFTALMGEHPALESTVLAVVAQRMRYR
jgi:CRP-like cAMP-binding protein